MDPLPLCSCRYGVVWEELVARAATDWSGVTFPEEVGVDFRDVVCSLPQTRRDGQIGSWHVFQ